MKSFSKAASIVFHPIFLFFYLYLAYWLLHPYPSYQLNFPGIALISSVLFLNTVLMPILFLVLGKRKLVNQNRVERQSSLLVMALMYGMTYYFFPEKFIPDYLRIGLLAMVCTSIIAFITTQFFKISLHSMGWGGVVAIFLYLLFVYGGVFFYPLLVVVLLAGLIGFCRLYLLAHEPREVYWGYSCGFGLTFFFLYWILRS